MLITSPKNPNVNNFNGIVITFRMGLRRISKSPKINPIIIITSHLAVKGNPKKLDSPEITVNLTPLTNEMAI